MDLTKGLLLIITRVIQSFLFIIILILLIINMRLFYNPSFETIGEDRVNLDVYQQLKHLKKELHHDVALSMQNIYPEGFIFINCLYGLTWANTLSDLDQKSEIFNEGIIELDWVLNQINSKEAKSVFDENLLLEHGVFYRGWTNILLANKLMLEEKGKRDPIEVEMYKKNCLEIAAAIDQSPTPFLESYQSLCWPADMTIAMASLDMYSELFDSTYQITINNWVSDIKTRLDPSTGLIPHKVEPIKGAVIEGARGSSQSLILNFMIDIDSVFAKTLFVNYKELFITSRLGLPAVREFPKNVAGEADVDSGPLIWGIGTATSIVGQRTMAKYGQGKEYIGLRNSINSFGMAYKRAGEKKYLFGRLPMADAFIGWSNSIEASDRIECNFSFWRMKFQIFSFILVLICFILLKIFS